MNEELMKSLTGAIDVAIKNLMDVDQLAKSDVSLQDAKLRPEGANGDLPGHSAGESALKPEDAKKAEAKAEPEAGTEHAAKGENPFVDKDPKDGKDDKSEAKEDKKEPKSDKKKDDDGDDDDMDDEKAEKLKAKIKKYEDEKAAKAAGAPAAMTKSDLEATAETLKKSIVSHVEEALSKSFNARLTQLEGMIEKLVKAPQPRQSTSGLAPLAKSSEDVQPAGQAAAPALNKGDVLDKLFTLQKSGDARVDSTVIARVDMNDFSVLAERGINLK